MTHMKTTRLMAVLIVAYLLPQAVRSQDYNILSEGAKGDGKTLNTQVIQETIDKCSAHGGGTIYFPPGTFLTGSIILKSHVTLDLGKGAVLLGSKNLNDYTPVQPAFVALRTAEPTRQLIFAEGQEDISITGEGTIDGQGAAFIVQGKGGEGTKRPHVLQLINCRDVTLEGIRMIQSGAWMQHLLACEGLQIRGLRIYNHSSYNNDGLDIDGCKNVTISDCIIDSDDDGLVLKSTSPRLCENVTISNCVISSHCNAIKLGTESTGGFRNIAISNCVVSPSRDTTPIYGIAIGQSAISVEMVDGGVLEQVSIDHISITETSTPIFVRLGNRGRKYTAHAPDPSMGSLHDVNISHIIAKTSSKTTSSITGIPGYPVKDITLSHIRIINTSAGTKDDVQREVPENIKGYPTAGMFGKALPASGFYVRHADHIVFDHVQISAPAEEVRPAYVFDDARDILLDNPGFEGNKGKPDLVTKVNGSDVTVQP